jgi:hypothetical protein
MGQEIVYCCTCQTRLVEAEFEKGKAFWIDHRACCKKCLPVMLESLPADKRAVSADKIRIATEPEKRPPGTSTPKRGTEYISKIPAPASSAGAPVAVLGGVAAVVVLVLAVLFLGSSGPAERSTTSSAARRASTEPSGERTSAVEPPPPPPRAREEKATVLAVRKARDFYKAEPGKIDEALALFEEAVWEARGTPLFDEVKKEFDAIQKKQGDLLQGELGPVLNEARAARTKEEWGRAIEILEKAVGRHPWRDWSAALQRELRDCRGDAEQSYAVLKDKAVQAKRGGDEAAAAAAMQRVRQWGLKDLSADFEKTLASIKPAPVLSPEAKAYRAAWEKAVRLAAGRGYADATRDLESVVKTIKTSALQAEASADLEAIRAAGRVPSEALQALSRVPSSQKLSLEVEDAAGNPVKVEGAFVRALTSGLELKTESGSTLIDFSDLTAGALAELFRGRDARALQVFLILEGEEPPSDSADPALLRLAAEVKTYAGAAWLAREREARALYARAEREFEDLATRFGSAEKYATLLAKHAETRLVIRRRADLAGRVKAAEESAKDYVFFPGEMRAGGLFQTVTHKKGEVALTLQSDQTTIKDHYVDLVFTALPDVEYKGWALMGACCVETYAHGYQGNDLSGPSPDKSGEKVAAEPGSVFWIAGKPPTVFLKRLHSMHGGPKQPLRWEWVALPVPKYATGGRKSFRILSGQQGFSLRAAVISVGRSAPPSDAEFKEVEKARLAVLQKPAPARDPTLVAHWKFDDGNGAAAVDSSGNGLNGTLINGPAWTAGRIGGALSFNGTSQYVDVGASPKLYFKGPFTLALWVNPSDVGNDKYHYFLGDYTAKGDQCSMALRIFKTGHAQFFWEYPSGVWTVAQSKTIPTVGKWMHLAGTWDGAMRRIYVNGVLEGVDGTPQQRPPSMGNLTLGRGGTIGALCTAGELDDVRIYSRALPDGEIQALVRSAPRK